MYAPARTLEATTRLPVRSGLESNTVFMPLRNDKAATDTESTVAEARRPVFAVGAASHLGGRIFLEKLNLS